MQNEGMPSWGSENFEPCVESLVPPVGCGVTHAGTPAPCWNPTQLSPVPTHTQDADLIVIEFGINDRAVADVSRALGCLCRGAGRIVLSPLESPLAVTSLAFVLSEFS